MPFEVFEKLLTEMAFLSVSKDVKFFILYRIYNFDIVIFRLTVIYIIKTHHHIKLFLIMQL